MRSPLDSSSTHRGVVVTLFASMMLLAACGSASVTASSTSAPAGAGNDATTTIAENDDDTTTTKAEGSGGGPGLNGGDFCALAEEAEASMDDVFEINDLDADPEEMLEAFKQDFKEVLEFLDAMAEAAPAEIKADVELFRDVYSDGLGDIDAITSIEELWASDLSELESEEVEAASDRVEAYLEDICDIDTDPVIEESSDLSVD